MKYFIYTSVKTKKKEFVRFAKGKETKNETVQNVFFFFYIKNKIITFFSMYQILDYREEYIHHQVIQ